jgi:hypothetical protein
VCDVDQWRATGSPNSVRVLAGLGRKPWPVVWL